MAPRRGPKFVAGALFAMALLAGLHVAVVVPLTLRHREALRGWLPWLGGSANAAEVGPPGDYFDPGDVALAERTSLLFSRGPGMGSASPIGGGPTFAFVTLVQSLEEVDGAVVLGATLRRHCSCVDARECTTVLLHTMDLANVASTVRQKEQDTSATKNGGATPKTTNLLRRLRRSGWIATRRVADPTLGDGGKRVDPSTATAARLSLLFSLPFERAVLLAPWTFALADLSLWMYAPQLGPSLISVSKGQYVLGAFGDAGASAAAGLSIDGDATAADDRFVRGIDDRSSGDNAADTADNRGPRSPRADAATLPASLLIVEPVFRRTLPAGATVDFQLRPLTSAGTAPAVVTALGIGAGPSFLNDASRRAAEFGQFAAAMRRGARIADAGGSGAAMVRGVLLAPPREEHLLAHVWWEAFEALVESREAAAAPPGTAAAAGVPSDPTTLSFFAATAAESRSGRVRVQVGSPDETSLVTSRSYFAGRNWTLPGLRVVAGTEGAACDAVCAGLGSDGTEETWGCSDEVQTWWRLNTCEALRAASGITRCESCGYVLATDVAPAVWDRRHCIVAAPQRREELPAARRAHARPRHGSAVVLPTCAARADGFARLCGCVLAGVPLHATRFTGADVTPAPADQKSNAPPPPTTPQRPNPTNHRHQNVLEDAGEGNSHSRRRSHADSDAVKRRKKETASATECPCPSSLLWPTGAVHDEVETAARRAAVALLDRCLSYLANASNIVSFDSLASDLRLGRTAKVRLTYRAQCVPPAASQKYGDVDDGAKSHSAAAVPLQAIAKLPQALYPLEPYAEYAAFEIDRLLGLQYVPPTSWIFLPVQELERAAARYGMGGETPKDGEGGRGGKAAFPVSSGGSEDAAGTAGTDYSRWFSREVMMHAMKNGLVIPHPGTGQLVLGCSVQLWVPGARPPHRTGLRWTNEDRERLDDLGTGQTPALAKKSSKGKERSDDDTSTILRYISDTMVLDWIIGNDDRAWNKNTHVFPVETGDRVTWYFVALDQGKSFYQKTVPSPLKFVSTSSASRASFGKRPRFCRFRRQTVTRLRALAERGVFIERLLAVLPESIARHIGTERLGWAAQRLGDLAQHVDRCIALYGADAVGSVPEKRAA